MRKELGLSLGELLVVLGVIGLVAMAAIPFVLSGNTAQDTEARRNLATAELDTALDMAKTELGLLPMNFGPAQALAPQMQAKEFGLRVAVPASCNGLSANGMTAVQAGDMGAELHSGIIVAGLRSTWDAASISSGADVVCVAVEGTDSDADETFLVTLRRDENRLVAAAPTSNLASGPAGTSADPSGGTSSGGDDVAPNDVPPDVDPGASGGGGGGVATDYQITVLTSHGVFNPWRWWEKLNDHAFGRGSTARGDTIATTYANFDPDSGWHEMKEYAHEVREHLGAATAQSLLSGNGNYRMHESQAFVFMGADGTNHGSISFPTVLANLSVNGTPWSQYKTDNYIDQIHWGGSLAASAPQIAHDIQATVNSYRNGNHHRGGEKEWRTFMNAMTTIRREVRRGNLDAQQFVYTDPNNGKTFELTSTFFSPIKINLLGHHARLNSDHSFAMDLDGFDYTVAMMRTLPVQADLPVNSQGVVQTSGGLNLHEAWLVTDRTGDGVFRQGILDGTDVFGDHQGQYPSGYEDLMQLYQHQIEKDEHGKRFIPLRQLGPEEVRQIMLERAMGHRQLHASYDLKLVTRDGRVIPASSVLTRLYVEYNAVQECDMQGKNCIFQRADVLYVNGNRATSADQWFTSK